MRETVRGAPPLREGLFERKKNTKKETEIRWQNESPPLSMSIQDGFDVWLLGRSRFHRVGFALMSADDAATPCAAGEGGRGDGDVCFGSVS